jgi:hypothetical protein
MLAAQMASLMILPAGRAHTVPRVLMVWPWTPAGPWPVLPAGGATCATALAMDLSMVPWPSQSRSTCGAHHSRRHSPKVRGQWVMQQKRAAADEADILGRQTLLQRRWLPIQP